MGPETVNRLKDSEIHGDFVGHDKITNIIMFQESEREFVVTHKTNVKPVSYFTGREMELQDLRERIEQGRKSVLVSGMGGIGKTHICRKLFEEYLNKHAEDEHGPFRHIGYVEYNGDINSSLQRCLKFKKQNVPEKNQEAAWRELEYLASSGKLLLFVDNVNVSIGEDPNLKRLMSIPGAIILTSRRRVFGKEFEPYRIGFLSTEKCKEIYERIRFEDSGKKVAEEEVPDLEYIIDTLAARHTITIEFLAHLALTNQWTVQELRDGLEENGFRLEYMDDEDKLINIQEEYEKLYDLSKLSESEQNILEAFSVFPYIPLKAEVCNQWLLADAGVSESDHILLGLYRKGWLQFDVEQKSYTLHPVFAQFIYEKCKPKGEMHIGLSKACQDSLENGSLITYQQYVLFAENIIERLYLEKEMEQGEFIYTVAHLQSYYAEYDRAKKWYKVLKKRCKEKYGEFHLYMALVCDRLAGVYEKQGEYDKAKELFEKSLTIYEKNFKENILYIAAAYNNIALIYRLQGKDNEAKDLFEKSLAIHEKELGEKNDRVLENYCNLSSVYHDLGNLDEAERLCIKALNISKDLLGENDIVTARNYSNLGCIYNDQERYEVAEQLHKKSIEIFEKKLGKAHPSTAKSYNNLAGVYRDLGIYENALKLYKKCLKIYQQKLRHNHPDISQVYNNMALVCEKQGEYDKAEVFCKKSLEIRQSELGEKHPYTANSYNTLGLIYIGQEKYKDAVKLLIKSLRIRKEELGIFHFDTMSSYYNVASAYALMKEYFNALEYILKAYKISSSKLLHTDYRRQDIYREMRIIYLLWNPKGNFEQWLEDKMKE